MRFLNLEKKVTLVFSFTESESESVSAGNLQVLFQSLSERLLDLKEFSFSHSQKMDVRIKPLQKSSTVNDFSFIALIYV